MGICDPLLGGRPQNRARPQGDPVRRGGPDDNHPCGDAKFETVRALGIVVFLSVTIFEALREAMERPAEWARSSSVADTESALPAGTLALNIWMSWYQPREERRWQSQILLADAAHTQVRGAATRRFTEMTFGTDGGEIVSAAHWIADDVEARLRDEPDLHEVVVHIEPC